jgi:hypothetical protein
MDSVLSLSKMMPGQKSSNVSKYSERFLFKPSSQVRQKQPLDVQKPASHLVLQNNKVKDVKDRPVQ